MAINFQKKVAAFKNANINVEIFDSANEVVEVSSRRQITSSRFHDQSDPSNIDKDWAGVDSLDEACELIRSSWSGSAARLCGR